MSRRQPVRPGEVSAVLAWAARLSRAGPGRASPAETAAYLTAKAALLERIAAEPRAQTAGARRDIEAAREAAAGARAAADAAAALAAAGITTLED